MDILDGFPREILASSKPEAQTYKVLPGHYAIHEAEDKVTVLTGSPEAVPKGKVTPVYSLIPNGSPSVPTGLSFIRFGEGIAVSDREAELQQAGYEIASTVSYAPNAAWIRARSGKIADGLAGLKALEKLPGVENVEPQMLSDSPRR